MLILNQDMADGKVINLLDPYVRKHASGNEIADSREGPHE